MSKGLRTAAIVVGAAALLATGVGAAASAGLIGASAGGAAAAAGATTSAAIAATATSIATYASAAATALSLASATTAPKGTVGGNATKFKIDKDSGIPIVFGRTYVGGNVLHRQHYNDPNSRMKNQRESWVTALSLGPVKSVGPLQIDKKPVAFSASGAAIGDFAGNMWLDTQLGACPEARALRGPTGTFPGWTASSKLSGIAADLWTLDFDSKGQKFPNGVPERGRVVEGVFCYDPRLDSTYPGGDGPCRIGDPSTHVYTENMWLQALTFAHGFSQNGHLVAGGGLPITGIDLNAFVQAANTADANGWKAGGLVYTTSDDDWDILKMLAQAGAGEVFAVGGVLSCSHAAPRVSIGTIASADIIGDVVAPSTASMRTRRNTIIPRVRLETQGWEVAPVSPVSVPEYLVIDRAPRPKEVEYPLIQSAVQGSQVAMYEMLDGRELDPIVLPCKLPTIGYRPGDCVTLDIPEANLVDRDVVLRERELDLSTFGITFSARTETASKHAYALGTSSTPPATPDLSVPDLDLDPPVGWVAVATMVPSPSVPMPAIVVSGLVDNGGAEAVQFDYRPIGSGGWLSAGAFGVDVSRIEITAVVAEAAYEVSVRYRVRGQLGGRLVLGPVTIPTQDVSVDFGNVTGQTKPADNADVTGDNTSRDTNAVGGVPAEEVVAELARLNPIASDVSALQDAAVGTDAALAALATATVDQATAQRQIERDAGVLGETLLRLVAESARTRDVLREAGIVVDPATGVVRLYAVDQLADRTARAEVAIDGVRSTVTSKASVAYVDERIAAAVLDPAQVAQLEPIIARLTSAEQVLDGQAAAIALKAEVQELTRVSGRVASVEQDLDALAGTISTKAERTEVDALATRTGSVEQTLSSLGNVSGIDVRVRQARAVADDAAEATLRAVLAGDATARRAIVQAAEARQELYTRIVDGDAAEATARTKLAVEVGTIAARAVSETTARVAGDAALGQRVDAIGVETGAQAAAIATLQRASIDAAGGIAGITTTIRQQARGEDEAATALLTALVAGDQANRARAAQLVQVQTELTTQLVANETAGALARQTLLARMGAAEAAIADTNRVLVTATQALTSRVSAAEAVIADPATGLPATRARVLAQADALAALDQATAQSVQQVIARLDDVGEVGVEQAIEAVVDRLGRVEGTYTLAIDSSGNVVGFQLVGSREGAGSLNLINTDLRMGTGRIIFNNGRYMQVQGLGFGEGGRMIEWYGPTVASIADCAVDNAIAYKTNDGVAVWRGGLLASGAAPQTVSSSVVGAQSLVSPAWDATGRLTRVLASFSWSASGVRTGMADYVDGPVVTIILYRKLGSAAEVEVGRKTVAGYTNADPMLSPTYFDQAVDASISYVDSDTSTAPRTWRLVASLTPNSPPGGASQPDQLAQAMTITSTPQ